MFEFRFIVETIVLLLMGTMGLGVAGFAFAFSVAMLWQGITGQRW